MQGIRATTASIGAVRVPARAAASPGAGAARASANMEASSERYMPVAEWLRKHRGIKEIEDLWAEGRRDYLVQLQGECRGLQVCSKG